MRERRRRIASRLALIYSVVFSVLFVAFSALMAAGASRSLTDQIEDSLADAARLVAIDLERGVDPEEVATEAARAIGARVTVIDAAGVVLADSSTDAESMENHGDRPEVVAAADGEVGAASRRSATLGEDRIYVAVPPTSDGRIVRISLTRSRVDDRVADVVTRVWFVALPVGLVGFVGVWLVGRRLARPISELTSRAIEVADGALDVEPRRSRTLELDRLGMAIADIAGQLGMRMSEAEDQRAALSSTLESLPQGVLLIEADGDISVSNDAARTLLGYRPERLSEVVPAALQRLVRTVREGVASARDEIQFGRPPRFVEATGFAVDDRTERTLLVLADVSEERRVAAMRRDFVADASHELKTPIASTLASIEAMQMALGRDPESAERFAGQAAEATRRLASIVGDLLDLSRLESSEIAATSVRVDEIVRSEIDGFARTARARSIELTAELAPVEVRGDPTELSLAVRNLVDNALRYSEAGGSVEVTLHRVEDTVELVIADAGVGIPSRSLDRIFERFFRVDVARSRATGGTGLGLALVKHVVERHGGAIDVESTLGVGSTFTVRLPM